VIISTINIIFIRKPGIQEDIFLFSWLPYVLDLMKYVFNILVTSIL